jgi:hypothetical protein
VHRSSRGPGGNPFFIEEVVRSLIDEGAIVRRNGSFEVTDRIDSVVIPPTINDVLMARIDRLEDRTRELVKVASVIGRSFFDRIIKDVAASVEDIDFRLAHLKDLQLIRDRIRMQELEYLFKHALAQEVAYESTLLQQRKAIHLKIAQSVEKLFQDRLHEFYGMLAYHYGKAEDQEKAEEYMVKAGEEALRSSASSEALNYFQQGLQLYTEKHGKDADPQKLALFEKNIALAYSNKAQWVNAVPYFDKVFSRWGRRPPRKQVSIMAKFCYDVLITLYTIYLPSIRPKRIPDQRTNEFFDLALRKDMALVFTNPKRCLTEVIGEMRESFKFDLTKLGNAAVLHLFASVMVSFAGFYKLAELVSGKAKTIVSPNNIHDVIWYQVATGMNNYLAGKWIEISNYEQSLFFACAQSGLFWDGCAYSVWSESLMVYRGEFSQAEEVAANLVVMEEKYRCGPFTVTHLLPAELLVVCRRLRPAIAEANEALSLAVEKGSQPFELLSVGWQAVIQVLTKDISGAKHSLARVVQVRSNQAFWGVWYLSSGLLAQFMLDLHLLQDAIRGESRSLVSECSKAALASGRKAAKNSAKFAAHRTWNYQLMGQYYWLIGKQRKALKWFDKSIREGKRLGARPDLSRTYMEVGKRLLAPHSKYTELNGITATAYLEKAEIMFREMELEWDLEELERVRQGT